MLSNQYITREWREITDESWSERTKHHSFEWKKVSDFFLHDNNKMQSTWFCAIF
jgi:hypothetical protein